LGVTAWDTPPNWSLVRVFTSTNTTMRCMADTTARTGPSYPATGPSYPQSELHPQKGCTGVAAVSEARLVQLEKPRRATACEDAATLNLDHSARTQSVGYLGETLIDEPWPVSTLPAS
jgi:hypothetical protein